MFIGYRTEIYSLKYKQHLGLLEKFEFDEKGNLKRMYVRTGLNFDANQKPELEEYMKKGLIGKEVWVIPDCPSCSQLQRVLLLQLFSGIWSFILSCAL